LTFKAASNKPTVTLVADIAESDHLEWYRSINYDNVSLGAIGFVERLQHEII
jgi:hypothetical protein